MFDIVYAEDDLSSIGSESAFGDDIPSDESVGSAGSSLASITSSSLLGAIDGATRTTADDLSTYYDSDLDSDCEDDEDDYVDESSISHHFHSCDVEATDDDLSFVSDDFDLNLSFSDDEDELISESNRFERTVELTPDVSSLRKRVPSEFHITSPGVEDDKACKCESYLDPSQSREQFFAHAAKVIQHGLATKNSRVPGICSLDSSLHLQRTMVRLPSRSVSLDVSVRL
ncbi:unnamed protein product [Cylindrotheca closterium]|uniref:Uncharacterized protein n=1 Tax=Cylindrotheca closterium TaxID=2856 RepID=A0AAD2CPM5_9STRA|nr:unnamed protein product [Cylindrotheca closterium]